MDLETAAANANAPGVAQLLINAQTGKVNCWFKFPATFVASESKTDSLQVVLGLLLRLFRGLLGIGVGLQLMDSLVQTLSLLFVSDLAAGHIRTGVHACRVCAEAVEIQSEIVAGVKSRDASLQRRKRDTGIGEGSVSGQHPLGLQGGGELLFSVTSASWCIGRIRGIFLDPRHRVKRMQTVRAILRDCGRARARRTLRRDAFHTHR